MFFVPTFSFSAVVNSTPNPPAGTSLKTGLLGWWTFDGKDMSNGAVVDKSGNGNTGTLQNIATSSFYTSGKIGQAFNFDGVDDSVKLTSDPIGTGAVTISAWINPESFGGASRGAIIWGNSTRFRITSIGFLIEFTSNGFTTTAQSASGSLRQLSKWYHVVVTRDSSNQATFYINGVISGTANQASGIPTGSSVGNIGESVSSANRFDGKIDDVRVYNRVLTTSEITRLYNEGNNKVNVTPKDNLKSGLVGWWTMDGEHITWTSSSAATIRDNSGNGLTGTLTSMNISTSTGAGRVGQGVNFSGVSTQITVNDTNALSFGNSTTDSPFTFSAWVKRGVTSKGNAILGKNGITVGVTPIEYIFYLNSSNKLAVILYDNNGTNQISLVSNSTFESDVNKWAHYAVSYNGSGLNTGLTLYRNGVAIAATASSAGTYVAMENSSNVLRIGNSWPNDPSPANRFPMTGTIDDVRIYNRVLPANDILELYNQGNNKVNVTPKDTLKSGLVSWWTMDGKHTIWTSSTAGTVTDASGNGNTGTLTNMVQTNNPVIGKIGQALNFDGGNDYVTFAQPSTGTGPLSLSVWVKTDTTGRSFNNGVGLLANLNNDLAGDFFLAVTSGYSVVFNYNKTGGNDPTGENETSSNVVAKNTWAHIVATWDGTNAKIYVNGVSKSFTNGPWGDWGTEHNMGRLANLSTYMLKGTLDDARIYNRALSSQEVVQLYNQRK